MQRTFGGTLNQTSVSVPDHHLGRYQGAILATFTGKSNCWDRTKFCFCHRKSRRVSLIVSHLPGGHLPPPKFGHLPPPNSDISHPQKKTFARRTTATPNFFFFFLLILFWHMGCPFQIFTSLPENGAPIKALSMKKPQVHTCSAEKLTPLMHKFRLKLASRMQDDLDLSWTKIWNEERQLLLEEVKDQPGLLQQVILEMGDAELFRRTGKFSSESKLFGGYHPCSRATSATLEAINIFTIMFCPWPLALVDSKAQLWEMTLAIESGLAAPN